MVFDEKSIKYPSLTEMTTADGHTFKEILEEKVPKIRTTFFIFPKSMTIGDTLSWHRS